MINIVDKTPIPQIVCIEINGYCNHADTELIEVDNGYPDMNIGDYVDSWETVMSCVKCGSVYDEIIDGWSI